ncbi:spore germination protein GerPE [Bacillus sp. E214]|uniref:spore germination protein GerPE n=1 Tax=Bacillus sp. E214 TaxID=2587156 RepID=UPI0011DFC5DD|nr:spore germination protein GerPE [Bacillus sp. E214]
MWERTSIVDHIHVSILSRGSTFDIGELQYSYSVDNVLAYQREQEIFYGQEGNFGDYKVFYTVPDFEPIEEMVHINFENVNPYLFVDCIRTQAISASSLLQVGNGRFIRSETRVMNVRQLLNRPKNERREET